jgi:outer membrane translocation and assembly module TamA
MHPRCIYLVSIINSLEDKENQMKKIVLVTMAVLLLIAGVVYAKGLEVKQKTGDLNVTVTMDKNPPTTGINNLQVDIKDASGKNVTDAKVRVDYSMPAMPGMPAMNYKTDAILSGQIYAAKLNISMSGPWNIAVRISKGGKTSSVKFNVDAQ